MDCRFEEILETDDVNSAFAKAEPFHDYHKIDKDYCKQMKEGKRGVYCLG
ncbi:MAG: hypothetical protein WBA16_12570 [Nonlabens sp.]